MLQAERSRRALPGEETPHLVLFRVGREALLNALRKTANTATAETTASAASESEEKEGLASRRLPRPPRMSPLILKGRLGRADEHRVAAGAGADRSRQSDA